jgi:hypothetical protein
MVATDKDSPAADQVREQIRQVCGAEAEVFVLQRGRIKGVNTAGACTLAYLGSMATFTGLDDCALHACLYYRRTFPDRPYVYSETGSPNWPGGRMIVPAMRTYFALRSLDEIYQAVWRTAVRNDRPAEAIVVIPDEFWLTALWRTVMPRMHLESAYRERGGTETVTVPGQPPVEFRWDYEEDTRMFGLRIIEMASGEEMAKEQVASEFGHSGDRAWPKSKPMIMGLLAPFFEEGSTNRVLRRKPR